MDYQIESCFAEIERMKHSDNIEKEFQTLKSQIIHSYKFGNKALLMSEVLNSILVALKLINNKLIDIDMQVCDFNGRLSNIEDKIDFHFNICK